ncbi:cytochrome P450 [Striga asiatica]|uniref:Cytochrome P450 n=1 Tax=Striga asiatica TaxID=4170 RepID=A0A5A7PAM2_STRAF|nr:cytochrome P450 [Striga asiatica]
MTELVSVELGYGEARDLEVLGNEFSAIRAATTPAPPAFATFSTSSATSMSPHVSQNTIFPEKLLSNIIQFLPYARGRGFRSPVERPLLSSSKISREPSVHCAGGDGRHPWGNIRHCAFRRAAVPGRCNDRNTPVHGTKRPDRDGIFLIRIASIRSDGHGDYVDPILHRFNVGNRAARHVAYLVGCNSCLGRNSDGRAVSIFGISHVLDGPSCSRGRRVRAVPEVRSIGIDPSANEFVVALNPILTPPFPFLLGWEATKALVVEARVLGIYTDVEESDDDVRAVIGFIRHWRTNGKVIIEAFKGGLIPVLDLCKLCRFHDIIDTNNS